MVHAFVIMALALVGFHQSEGGQPCKDGNKQGGGITNEMKDFILNKHNEYRNQVAGGQILTGVTAANMSKMVWDAQLARSAQDHADGCEFRHYDPDTNKAQMPFGQNLYISYHGGTKLPEADWEKAIKSWTDESKDFSNDKIMPYQSSPKTTHFTQMSWATANKIGCGYTLFKLTKGDTQNMPNRLLYTCHYLNKGNILGTNVFEIGQPCAACPGKCDSEYKSLCAW